MLWHGEVKFNNSITKFGLLDSFHILFFSSDAMDTATAEKYRRRIGVWRCATILLFAAISITLVAFTAFLIIKDRQLGDVSESSIPCPPQGGGLLTSSDPESPSPFHDITLVEYQRLFAFLQTVRDLNLSPPSKAAVNTSNIFMVDLILPPKSKVIQYLDKGGQQPSREARVIVFRGDKEVPLVEEYVCLVRQMHKILTQELIL